MLGMANSVNTLRIRYDEVCKGISSCPITFTPDVTLKNPKFYYEIRNFYANHRNFVKSLSYAQLRGDADASVESCDPIEENEDVSSPLLALDGSTLSPGGDANPCGLRAKYHFTDTFTLAQGGTNINIDQTKISHSVDRNSRFQDPDNYRSIQWTRVEDEHFMVWFQSDAFPDFIKLWGRIDQDLEKGTAYTVTISNTWDTSAFDTEKHIFISETNAFGGDNVTLGVLYTVAGSVFFLLSVAMIVLEIRKRGKAKIKIEPS